ncbi:MAG: type II toxin-antitoxin system VapC family toxin [Pseudomonadota bacterium]
MIILDTNVLSELMRSAPNESVVAWLDQQPAESIWTTTVTVFEVRYGLAAMPEGKKRRALEAAFDDVLQDDLRGRVLGFDLLSASESARIAATLRAAGDPVEIRDAMIAGIVAARHATLATRNTRHFKQSGVALVDPSNVA